MTYIQIAAQSFGIIGLILAVFSFQEKNNNKFFIMQALSGLMFMVNYLLIGAVAGTLFNMTNLVRGTLFKKSDRKLWKLVLVVTMYTLCVAVSLYMVRDSFLNIFLTFFIYGSIQLMSVLMWLGNGKHIRYGQFLASSPTWLVYNIFNFTLGGIICELFAMTSVVVSFIRFGKDGFEK